MVEVWKPIPREEYEKLPVWEQLRHCQILANYYRGLAGPFHTTKPEPINPEKFAKYTPLAERCEKEAERLAPAVQRIKSASSDKRNGRTNSLQKLHFDLDFMQDA